MIRSVRSGAVIVADYIVRIDSLNYGSVFYYAVLICIAQSILLQETRYGEALGVLAAACSSVSIPMDVEVGIGYSLPLLIGSDHCIEVSRIYAVRSSLSLCSRSCAVGSTIVNIYSLFALYRQSILEFCNVIVGLASVYPNLCARKCYTVVLVGYCIEVALLNQLRFLIVRQLIFTYAVDDCIACGIHLWKLFCVDLPCMLCILSGSIACGQSINLGILLAVDLGEVC